MANSRFISGIGPTPFVVDKPREIPDGLKTTPASTITIPGSDTLAGVDSESLHPTGFETVSSYNWVYGPGKRLKIIVPGYPSCWNAPNLPVKLPSDIGFRMIHQNEYFSPGTPLRPLLRAVFTNCPDYDIKSVDFVTDRNSLLKLFKFIRGDIKSNSPPPPAPPAPPSRRTSGDFSGRGRGSPSSPSWRDRYPSSSGSGLRGRAGGLGFDSLRNRGSPRGGQYLSDRRPYPNGFEPPSETRIDVDIMGNEGGNGKPSMLLSRWETQSSEMIKAGQFRGWGYQFLNTFTKFGDAGEDAVMDDGELQSHHRVVAYTMGGFRFLVRYHGDAATESLGEFRWWVEKNKKAKCALKKKEAETTRGSSNSQSSGKKADDWLEKEFVEGISKLTLNRVKTTIAIEAHKNSTPLYPHSSIVGIKTCSIKSSSDMMVRALPQVFFSQTPHLYVGYQNKGVFERVEKIETAPRLSEWEKENEVALKKLLTLLARIRTVVEGMEGRRAALVFCHGKESEGIKVYKRQDDTGVPVPSDLVAKWDC